MGQPQDDLPHHPVVAKIEALLHERGTSYKKFEHQAVRTSQEASAVRPEYTLSQGAKALIVRVKRNAGKEFAMIVVPGNERFDIKKACNVLGAKDIRFATPEEVSKITDGVEPGGVPPFGNLFHLPVFADKGVFQNEEIIFNAGDRRVSIAISAQAYREAVMPAVVGLC